MSARGNLEARLYDLERAHDVQGLTQKQRADATAGWIIGPGRQAVLTAIGSNPPENSTGDRRVDEINAARAEQGLPPRGRSELTTLDVVDASVQLARDVASLACLLAEHAGPHVQLDQIARRWS